MGRTVGMIAPTAPDTVDMHIRLPKPLATRLARAAADLSLRPPDLVRSILGKTLPPLDGPR
jgi:hypothetical protein